MKLFLARALAFAVLAGGVVGCSVDDTVQDPSANQGTWLVVDTVPTDVAVLNRSDGIPDSFAALHWQTHHAFVKIDILNGGGRMLLMETKHGSIPNPLSWGAETRYHFRDLDDRVGKETQWELKNLQLIGLIKQPQGVAYQTPAEKKIAMDKLKEISTRALDEFEFEALKQLQEGKEAVAFVEHDRVRMLGAVRMGHDCKKCHEQPQGTLLGAFTYDLARDPNLYVPPPKKEKNPNEIVLP